jgi:hypothetical protein
VLGRSARLTVDSYKRALDRNWRSSEVMMKHAGAAEAAFNAFTSQVNRCQTFTETASDGTVTSYSFSPLSFGNYGDETFATALHATSSSFPVEGNFVFFRQGRYVDGV